MDYQTLVVACEELTRAAVEGEDLGTLGRRLKTVECLLWDMKFDQYEERLAEIARRTGVVGEGC